MITQTDIIQALTLSSLVYNDFKSFGPTIITLKVVKTIENKHTDTQALILEDSISKKLFIVLEVLQIIKMLLPIYQLYKEK